MANIVEVRNLKLGEGIPKICVPLVGKTNEEIIEEAKFLKNVKFDLIEWRVDHYENVENLEKVKEIVKALREEVGETVILFTFRSKKEGGEIEVSDEYYAQLNKTVAETKLVDLVDVELFTGDEIVKDIVETAHNNGVKVVMSNHDFFKTPAKEEIISRLCKMQDLGADLPKIAVMPNTSEDVVTLLAATEEMSRIHSDKPLLTMAMGREGSITRLAGELFGSAITFCSLEAASAPGQVQVKQAIRIMDDLHEVLV